MPRVKPNGERNANPKERRFSRTREPIGRENGSPSKRTGRKEREDVEGGADPREERSGGWSEKRSQERRERKNGRRAQETLLDGPTEHEHRRCGTVEETLIQQERASTKGWTRRNMRAWKTGAATCEAGESRVQERRCVAMPSRRYGGKGEPRFGLGRGDREYVQRCIHQGSTRTCDSRAQRKSVSTFINRGGRTVPHKHLLSRPPLHNRSYKNVVLLMPVLCS